MSLESVAPADSLREARNYLSAALAGPQTIAPLSRVCAQLAELTAHDEIDGAQLGRLIQSDPALAGELMRVANSPALRPRAAIVSLQQAISWLGIAEVRNISMAVMLRGEVFKAPGHEPESEELWREGWLASLWAKEIARERRKHVESAFLAALMHRAGAALALKILSRYESETRAGLEAQAFTGLVVEFELAFGRLLMTSWLLPKDVQDAASGWRNYRESAQPDLAATVHAAHLLATHALHPELLDETLVIESPVFEPLGIFPDDRRRILAKRDQVLAAAGI